ncbi:hypothetical protein ACQKNX_17355 [Lysinibacillus sp. NPDC093712]|uniref:hypothetical protein n=1 Tax=Lysinibacillus sp. NPDC093712 TaxID=3390579 RepID=UPI003CFC18F6
MSILFIVVFAIMTILLTSGPPKPIVSAEGETITLVQGSYCWNKIIGFQCVDKIPPPDILEIKKITPFPVAPNSEIKIRFKKPPIDEIEVEKWLSNSESPLVKVEGDVFSAPQEKGIYIYTISGRWDKGSSSFVFSIRVK